MVAKQFLVRVVGFDRVTGSKKDFKVPTDISMKGLEDIRKEVDVRAMYWPNGARCELSSVTDLIVLEPPGSRISPDFSREPMQGYASRWDSEEPLHEMPHGSPRSRDPFGAGQDAMLLELIMILSQACDSPFPAQYEQRGPRRHDSPFTAQDEPVADKRSRFKAFAAKKWAGFKNALRTHPETNAYIGAMIASFPIGVIPHAPKTVPLAGLLAGVMAAGAATRENILKKSYTKAERITSSIISGVGYAASAALVLASHHLLGIGMAISTLTASILYKPLKEFKENASATLGQKIGLLILGATTVAGLVLAIYNILELTMNLNLNMNAALNFFGGLLGFSVADSAAKQSVEISKEIKPQESRQEPEAA